MEYSHKTYIVFALFIIVLSIIAVGPTKGVGAVQTAPYRRVVVSGPIPEVLSAFSKQTNKKVVAILPQEQSPINNFRADGSATDVLQRLSTQLQSLSMSQDDEVLIYRLVPPWFNRSAQQIGGPLSVLPNLDTFTKSLSTEQKVILLTQDNIAVASLSDAQKQHLVNFFDALYAGDINRGQSISSALAYRSARFSLRIVPRIFIYKGGMPTGAIQINASDPHSVFDVGTTDYTGNYDDWAQPKILIEPSLSLQDDQGDITLRLERVPAIWKLSELAKQIEIQTQVRVTLSPRIANIPLFVSGGEWKLKQLMQAVGTVAGLELRKVANTYFWTESRAHTTVASTITVLQEAAAAQNHVLSFFSGKLQSQAFSKIVAPLDPNLFALGQPIGFDRLTLEQQNYLRAVLPKQLITDNQSTQVLFVLNMVASIRANDTSLLGPIGTTLTVVSPYTPLAPPEGSDFQAYNPDAFRKLYGAQIKKLRGDPLN